MSEEKQYILKQPISKDMLLLLLEQLWVSGFQEAQRKEADIYTTKKHSIRFIEQYFVEFDVELLRQQIRKIFPHPLEGVSMACPYTPEQLEEINLEYESKIDAVLALIKGDTK